MTTLLRASAARRRTVPRCLHRPIAAAGLALLAGLAGPGAAASAAVPAPVASAAAPPATTRISVDSTGGQAVEYYSEPFGVSADGRYVSFTSEAPNLTPDDTNDNSDVFVHDRRTGTTSQVSRSTTGTPGNSASLGQSLSPDGRYVSFASDADNLVPGDTNGVYDGFVHDRRTGTTTRVTLTDGDTQADAHSYAPAISADGRFVAFASQATNHVPGDTNGLTDIFLRDRQAGTIVRVSGENADAPSEGPVISADGRFVAFTTEAALVPDDIGGVYDVYVHDVRAGSLQRVNVSTTGDYVEGITVSPTLSADGRFVAFTSDAALAPDDTNGVNDVYVRDLRAGTTVRASSAAGGGPATGGGSYGPALSADGRYVVLSSDATDLVARDTNGVPDVFLRAGTTVRVSLSAGGRQANNHSYQGVVTPDGRQVAFASGATNLVPGDTNGVIDVFLRRLPR
ncbi:WD40-like Beta Propeller Repeat [Micromonospora matsumotoense]|uniref:WD40-like Beta Propeller Repeat n=1 Tax=Micromonospora matsumotoense TaxID=121616 RepID=A0A1C4U5G6_9ACTN|nr:PD40 domain-containing protein [Micromonospora matsumotoense]SCE66940.1 WD40-like Beta Propeller Repeat [Micromonospora matsumotoense]